MGDDLMKIRRRIPGIILAAAVMCGLVNPVGATGTDTATALSDTAAYVYRLVSAPQVGSIGGEWAILGLARSNYTLPDSYYQQYYTAVERKVAGCGGVLSTRKYTEYSRVIVALTAIGRDPADVAGYNLLTPLGDYDKTIYQGVNGAAWALIALDSGSYAVPVNSSAATQATRQMYVDKLLSCQLSGGGWNLTGMVGSTANPDITGMVIQALAKYQNQTAVQKATDAALACMSAQQCADGSFASDVATGDADSTAQMTVALCELGISVTDSRFVKNGKTVVDALLSYYTPGSGFSHAKTGTGVNQMATEQGLYALASVRRADTGANSLYRMSDAVTRGTGSTSKMGTGLPNKNAAICAQTVSSPDVTFVDISTDENRGAIEALASRGILMGKTANTFAPDALMTRAQFTAVIVRAFGLTPETVGCFTDVKATAPLAGYIGTAYSYGIVTGTGADIFSPNGTITRQQAAAMIARAAKLGGEDMSGYTADAVRNILSAFSDYTQCASTTMPGLAFCYDKGILDSSAQIIQPQKAVSRGEVAQMLYRLLIELDLLA